MSTVTPLIYGVNALVTKVMRSRVPGTAEHLMRTAGDFIEKAPKDLFVKIKRDVKHAGEKLGQEAAEAAQSGKSNLDSYIEYLSGVWKNESPTAVLNVLIEDATLLLKSLLRYAREVLDKGLQSVTQQ